MLDRNLILLRGLPGSGKSTFAKALGKLYIEADSYFISRETGEYQFDASKLKEAHEWCRENVDLLMDLDGCDIVVSNTFTQEWEMEPYFKLAEKYGYRVHTLVVENRHGGVNEHNVPAEKLEQMKNRFKIRL